MNSLVDEFGTDTMTRAERRARERRKKFRRRRLVAILVIAVLLLGGGAVVGVLTTKNSLGDALLSRGDYEGEGKDEVKISIAPGSSARQVANQLVDEGVIKAAGPFLKQIEEREIVIQAGTFTMRREMSSKAAADVLEAAEAANKLTLAEGNTIKVLKKKLAEHEFSEDEINAALDDKKPKDYGLDVDAPSLEGYLHPATYEIHADTTPEKLVQSMVDGTKNMLNEQAISNDDANYFMTLASLVEIEATGDPEVRAKVARVFINRLSKDSETHGYLQSDATVAYIFGARQDLSTTAEQRKSDSPYNTYKHKGLPPGPVNSPSDGAYAAAKNPAEGKWEYFVATDPDKGVVKFAETFSEHEKNVKEYQKWLREHREKNG